VARIGVTTDCFLRRSAYRRLGISIRSKLPVDGSPCSRDWQAQAQSRARYGLAAEATTGFVQGPEPPGREGLRGLSEAVAEEKAAMTEWASAIDAYLKICAPRLFACAYLGRPVGSRLGSLR
jgi:hypothetical protein